MSSDTPTNSPDDKDQRQIGKYKILGTLGRGSMGVVYKGQDPEIGRIVAVKTLRRIASSQFQDPERALERFKVEARSAGNLRHPNIITVFDVSVDGDIPYIVMDYVVGETLDRLIAKRNGLSPGIAIKFLKQIAAGLDYAHSKGVLHRDIKPNNLLVDENQNVYILDFGIARINETFSEADKLVKSEPVMGTPGYMSPEAILNKDLDNKTDIFGLAVVAYECLSGKKPFTGADFNEVLGNILNKPEIPITTVSNLPDDCDAIFALGLAKKKSKRPVSAASFVSMLETSIGLDRASSPAIDTGEYRRQQRSQSGQWNTVGGGETGGYQGHTDGLSKTPNVPLGDESDEALVQSPIAGQNLGGYTGKAPKKPSMEDLFGSENQIYSVPKSKKVKKSNALLKPIALIATCSILIAIIFMVKNKSRVGAANVVENGLLSVPDDSRKELLETGEEPPEPLVLQLPKSDPAPAGKIATEMTNKELLGSLLDKNSSESEIIRALHEAERRKMIELVPISAKLIAHDSLPVRMATVKLLGSLSDPDAVPVLLGGLEDYDPRIRLQTARSVGKSGSRKSLSFLRASMAKESNPAVRKEIKAAIEKITGYPLNE